MAEVEVIDRIERRRKWSEAEKVSLLAEVEAAGGKVAQVARATRDLGEPAVQLACCRARGRRGQA